MKCDNFGEIMSEFHTSPRVDDSTRKPFQVNKKIVESTIMMGIGYAGLQRFCSTMNMNILNKKPYQKIIEDLSTDFMELKEKVLGLAREKVREYYMSLDSSLSADSVIDYSVTYDGTWQKRGFTSLYGIGFVIELFTGIIIDYEIISKFCRICSEKEKTMDSNSEEFKK